MKPLLIKLFAALLFWLLQVNCYAQQYCEYGIYASGCNPTDNIHSVSITGTTLHVTGNYCTNQGALNVTIFPDTGSATCNLVQGQTYQLNVQSTANRAMAFWIDYNHNSLFDVNEFQQICNSSLPNATTSIAFTVHTFPYFGKTRMRIMSAYAPIGISASDACSSFTSGEIEDYSIFLLPSAICANPINGGSAISSIGNSICYGNETILSLQGNTIAGAITYQWESSFDSITWSILPGGAAYNDTIPIFLSAYYRCAQFCSGLTSYSVPVFIELKPFYNCYCASLPTASTTFNSSSHIGNVKLGNLNNGNDSTVFNRPGASGTYSDFTNLSPAVLMQGNNYSMRVVVVNKAPSGFYTCLLSAFIDYNHNGIFDEPYEKIISDASVGGKFKFNKQIQIPYTALTGITRMRVIACNENYYKNGACFSYYTGETEDYFVNIQTGISCSTPVIAGNTIASNGPLLCLGEKTIFSLSGGSSGSSQNYEWQFSLDSTTWYPIPNANNSSFEDSIFNGNYYRCKVTCGGSIDYSVPYKIELLAPSQCYCSAISTTSRYYGSDIGNFNFGSLINGIDTIPVLGNSTAKTVYSNFVNLPLQHFNRGSSYVARIKQISSSFNFDSASARIFIDYNQDGNYNLQTESVFLGKTSNSGTGSSVSHGVLIPNSALTGITGLRAMIQDGTPFNTSCGAFYTGEVEDYLIYIDFANNTEVSSQGTHFEIFPNPASDKVSIRLSSQANCQSKLFITDITGRKLAAYSISAGKSNFEISIDTLQTGLYVVYLVQQDKILGKQKLIVTH